MEALCRPEKIWERRGGKPCLSRKYLAYLRNLIQVDEDEKKELRELGVRPTENSVERIEDFPGTAAFIEGDRA